jgi:Xaa-Pro aminopeptidase
MERQQEVNVKIERVRRWLAEQGLGGVLLRTRANFAWLTAGGLNYVNGASETGVGSLLVTADRFAVLSDNIESERLLSEELSDIEIEAIDYPWHHRAEQMEIVARLCGGVPIGVDAGDGGPNHADQVRMLRTPLLESEIERYRALAHVTAITTEEVCRQLRTDLSEQDVVGLVQSAFAIQSMRVPVCLVAADERIDRWRHPIATDKPIERRAMVVVCAEWHGLICAVTRLVSFEAIDEELKIKHRAVCQVDATAIAATRIGRPLGDVFADIIAEYERQGFGEQWALHHQGGSIGYEGRDVFATPGCPVRVAADQAFAWNPSIAGTKSEDTILVRDEGIELLSQPGPGWPVIEIEREGQSWPRADILVPG